MYMRRTTNPTYDRHILAILTEAGETGVSLCNLVTNVVNLSSTLFDHPDKDKVYRYVQRFLLINSHTPYSLLERISHGRYRLNTRRSDNARQLLLEFGCAGQAEEPMAEASSAGQTDLSLSLFD